MWPKMLLELLPHFARLVPMADKFFATRTASERAQEAALAALAEEVRGQLGKATQTHTGIYRQLQDQSRQVSEMAVEVTKTRMAIDSVEARVTKLEKTAAKLEKTAAKLEKMARTAIALLVATFVLMAVGFGVLVTRLH
jgi:chromosome segregation ATPase